MLAFKFYYNFQKPHKISLNTYVYSKQKFACAEGTDFYFCLK